MPWRAMNHCHAPVGQGFYSSITFAFLRVGVSLGSRVHETNWKIFLKTVSIKNKTHKTGKKRQTKATARGRASTGPGEAEAVADTAQGSVSRLGSTRRGKVNARN